MTIQDIQKQIISKQLDNVYIFVGEEIAIEKIYINKLAQINDMQIEYVDSYTQIKNRLKSTNLFNETKLYVVIDDNEFTKAELIWGQLDYLESPNIIVFKYNTLDKRSKFYKHYENKIVEFNKLSDDVLTHYIQKEINLSGENCKKLIDICGNNYNQILLEIDKLKNIEGTGLNYFNDKFIYLERQGAFHKEISDITFEFVDKVLKRKIKSVFELQKQLHQIDESNIKLLSLLYTGFKTVLLIQSCKSNDICKTTGLQYYQVKYNQDKVNIYSTNELVCILKLIQYIEESIKIGTIDEAISIDYLLVNIL